MELDETGEIVKATITETTKAKQSFSDIIGKLSTIWNITKRIANTISKWITSAIDYQETVNLFNVSMGTSVEQATKFQNKIAEAFGVAKAEMMEYQSAFKNMLSALGGITTSQAENISESITQMSLDYASLFNVSESTAASKFKSALSGSIIPIRAESGYDISLQAVKAKAEDIGISKSTADLTQMEKRLLRIILLMEQMRNTGAFNDLSRTIESPSNQIKVLKNQVQELGVWLGNVFVGTVGKILPYINGFVMALKEVVKVLAIFVGYEETSTGMDDIFEGMDSAEDTSSGISDNLSSAADSAKEIKKQLQGFDVLNVITTPTTSSSSGSGSSSSGVGTIDPAILSALSEYDSLMSSVQMKATAIRDKIMEWLGFTKSINPLTGDISWKLKEGFSNLKLILGVVGSLIAIGIIAKVLKLIGNLSTLWKVLKTGTGATTALQTGLLSTKNALIKLGSIGNKTATTTTKLLTGIKSLVKIIAGLVLEFKGANNITEAFNSIVEDGTSNLKQYTLGMTEMAAGGALIGSIFGTVGTAIGLVAGSLAGLVTTIIAHNNAINQIAENNLYGELTVSSEEWLSMLESGDTELTNWQNSLSTFNSTMQSLDEQINTNVNSLELYLTKFSLASYKITDEDIANIESSITALGENAISAVDTSTDRALTLFSDTFKSADGIIDEEEQGMLDTIYEYGEKQKSKISEAQNNITTTYQNAINTRGYLTDQERKYIEEQLAKIEEITKKSMGTSETDIQYYIDRVQNSTETGFDDVFNLTQESYKNFNTAAENYLKEQEKKRSTSYNTQAQLLKNMLDDGVINEDKYNEDMAKLAAEREAEEEEANNNIKKWKEELYSTLITKYYEIKDETDETSIAMKKKLEEAFKDADIDISSVSAQVKTKGVAVGNEFSQNVSDSANTDLSKSIYYNQNTVADTGYSLGQRLGTNAKSGFTKWFNLGKLNIGTSESGALTFKWGSYAVGGLPDVGEMFIAREAGPELVGRIGNQTAVANNDQIVQAVSTGVANAVSQVLGNQAQGGASYNLYLDGKQLTDVVQKRINRNANIVGA